jgi:hypothetical protein
MSNILEVFEEGFRAKIGEDYQKYNRILEVELGPIKLLPYWTAVVNCDLIERFWRGMNKPGRHFNGMTGTVSSFEPFSSIEDGHSDLVEAFEKFKNESEMHKILAKYGYHSPCSSVDRSCYFSHNFFVKFNGSYYLVYEEEKRSYHYDSTNVFYDITAHVEEYEEQHKGLKELLDLLEVI